MLLGLHSSVRLPASDNLCLVSAVGTASAIENVYMQTQSLEKCSLKNPPHLPWQQHA